MSSSGGESRMATTKCLARVEFPSSRIPDMKYKLYSAGSGVRHFIKAPLILTI